MSRFKRWTIDGGVPAGAAKPTQNFMIILESPASGADGTSGNVASRSSLVTISARSLPDWISDSTVGADVTSTCTLPPMRSCSTAPAPR